MKPISDLVHRHMGATAVVMGGGMSLPSDVARAPENCLFISANQHGCLLRKCDYIVACDDKPGKLFLGLDKQRIALRDLGVPILSPRVSMADYRIFTRPLPNNSGIIGAWLAWVMGCAPILLAGMNCYQGGTYFHAPKEDSAGKGLSLNRHLDKWRSLRAAFPEAMFLAISGPLTSVFPEYKGQTGEAAVFPPKEEVEKQVFGLRVRVVKQWRSHPEGTELQVAKFELQEGQREGKLQAL